jgi:hypothetical protein
MFRINTCLLDAKLTQDLEDAILNVARVEDNQALCPMQANERFAGAQAEWIEHKVICQFLLWAGTEQSPLTRMSQWLFVM